jgi:uncharacterized OB-fold protein
VTESAVHRPAITALGASIPNCAISARGGTLSACNGDQDAVTLAIAAGQNCLDSWRGSQISQLCVVLGNPPAGGSALSELIREGLGLPADVFTSYCADDPTSAVSGLWPGTYSHTEERASATMVIASESGDRKTVGAGAVAALVQQDSAEGIFLSSLRTEGAAVYASGLDRNGTKVPNDSRFLDTNINGAVNSLLESLEHSVGVPSIAAIAGRVPTAAKRLFEGREVIAVGNFGVASLFFGLLAGARAADGSSYMVLDASARRSTALVATPRGCKFRLPDPFASTKRIERYQPPIAPDLSLPTTSPFYWRCAGEFLRLEGARCETCGHIAFPPSQRPVCSSCGGSIWRPHRLARSGTIYTFTVNNFLPSGFGDHMVMVLGQLDDGTRYWAPASGMAQEEARIGAPVSLSLRRFTEAGGVPVYGMKFISASGQERQGSALS